METNKISKTLILNLFDFTNEYYYNIENENYVSSTHNFDIYI